MVFEHALAAMERSGQPLFGPTSFRDYVSQYDIETSSRTPRYISVDSLSDLAPELRERDVMVLRVGTADGTGTAFLCVNSPDGVEAFFLQDAEIYTGQSVEKFSSPLGRERLLGFDLLPRRSETSLVNLGLASGVLSESLRLDTSGALPPPATGNSTFTFPIKPHSDISTTVTHRRGQVEIDTLFAERRNGELALFVIEAKTGSRGSLAKHKLMYPVFALADSVPSDIEIIPVYLRCRRDDDTITFDVAECEMPDPRTTLPAVTDLTVTETRVLELAIQ